jgi:pSer/pThr/pTyr-binding forkhead associated (FHA) protein
MPEERIEVTGGPASGSTEGLEEALVIGRSEEGFGTLGGDPEISRRHAQISRTPEGRLYISDLGSTNGTFVNDQRIAGPTTLQNGDKITVGLTTLELVSPQAQAAPRAQETQAVPRPTLPPERSDATAIRTAPPITTGATAPPPAEPAVRQPEPFPRFATATPEPSGRPPRGGPPKPLIGILALVVIGGIVALVLALSGGSSKKSSATGVDAVTGFPPSHQFTAMAQGPSTTVVTEGQPDQVSTDLTFVVAPRGFKHAKVTKTVATGKVVPFAVRNASYTLTTPGGDTLELAADGFQNPPSPLLPDHYMSDSTEVWSVRSGTGRFANARGDGQVMTSYIDIKRGDPTHQAVVAVFVGELILPGG